MTSRLKFLPVLLPLSIFLTAGWMGLDFGRHWDEQDHIENVQQTLRTGVLLPEGTTSYNNHPGLAGGYYGYPSVIYWISLLSATPEILSNLGHVNQPKVIDFIASLDFKLRVRAVCLCISSLGIVWVYLLVLRWRKSSMQALLAASLLGTSWELNYHSRWIATDAIVMQFAALCLLFCVLALEKNSWRWVKFGAIAAGLAAGTKYPACILLVMVWAAAWTIGKRSISQIALLGAIAVGTFLITTPGAILQPAHFYHWLQFNRVHYGMQGHFGYTIGRGWPYLKAILIYEFLVFFSHYPPIALALTLPAIIGALALARQSPRGAIVILIFPVCYVSFFTTQVVLIVRNLLALAPFLAVLATLGISQLMAWLGKLRLRQALGCLFAAALTINAYWMFYAAESIRYAPYWTGRQALLDYMHDHRNTRFSLDPYLEQANFVYPQLPRAGGQRELVVVGSWETPDELYQWPANIYNLYEYLGPYNVNFNYYPTWLSNRIVMMDIDTARKLHLDLAQQAPRNRH